MAAVEITRLLEIGLAAVAAPLLALALRRLAVPGVVIELLLGVLLGPVVLDWVEPTGLVLDFANLGLTLLMFLAGLEVDLSILRGRTLTLAAGSWAGSLLGALVIVGVLLLAGHRHGEFVIALSMTTTALGTLLPIAADAGLLAGVMGRHILAIGTIGEFGPIVLVALLLSGDRPVFTVLLLAGFGLIAVLLAYMAHRPWGRSITEVLRRGLYSSSQLPVRVAILVVIALVFLASNLGLDALLGAFVAGVVVHLAVEGQRETVEAREFRGKLEAIGFGVFIPVFFVVSGARLDLDAFGRHPLALAAIPMFFVLLLLIRGVPTLLVYRTELATRERLSMALLSATGLPLIVVITTIGTANGYVATQTAAALVTAGVLTVLLLPAVAVRLATGQRAVRVSAVNDRESL